MPAAASPAWLPICCLVLAGCAALSPAPPVQFQSFEERQQSWPTQPLGLMHVVDGVPVYDRQQLPPEPYEILGFITAVSPSVSGRPDSDLERAVVQRAQQENGQAVVLTALEPNAERTETGESEYLVIRFQNSALATVLERAKVYLALHPVRTNSPATPDGELDQELEQLQRSQTPPPSDRSGDDRAFPLLPHRR